VPKDDLTHLHKTDIDDSCISVKKRIELFQLGNGPFQIFLISCLHAFRNLLYKRAEVFDRLIVTFSHFLSSLIGFLDRCCISGVLFRFLCLDFRSSSTFHLKYLGNRQHIFFGVALSPKYFGVFGVSLSVEVRLLHFAHLIKYGLELISRTCLLLHLLLFVKPFSPPLELLLTEYDCIAAFNITFFIRYAWKSDLIGIKIFQLFGKLCFFNLYHFEETSECWLLLTQRR
jgi:hypothetical protein